jgi:hypothetical protein
MSAKVLENVVVPSASLEVRSPEETKEPIEVTEIGTVTETAIIPVPVLVKVEPKNPVISYLKLAARKLLRLGAEQEKTSPFKGTKLHNENSSPDLTPDEISKIQNNLKVIKKFYKDLYDRQTNIIIDVWGVLQKKTISESQNNVQFWLKNILATCGVICSIVAIAFATTGVGIIFAIGAACIGATASFIATDMKSTEITGHDISADMGYAAALNTKTLNCMTKMFDYYIDNTNECRDVKFEIEGNSHVLRDLLIEDMHEDTMYDNLLILSARVYKNKLVMPELTNDVNKQFLDLYFIQDTIRGTNVEHGHCYQPCGAPIPPGIQRERDYNKGGVGNGVGIWSNEEVVHFNHCNQVDVYGNSDTDLTSSYLNAIKEFTNKMPSTYVYPWIITNEKVISQKYFIVMGFAKLRDDQNKPEYTLPETDFLNWLFIDDGAGNITNPEGVCFRYDALRAKSTLGMKNDVFLHAQQIGDQINNIVTNNIICSSSDFRYGPKDSSELNKEHHVYVGDIKKLMKI